MRKLRFFISSDLHLFQRGSRFEEIKPRFMEEVASSDVIVLNGDIIEMFFPKHLQKYKGRFPFMPDELIPAYEEAARDGIKFIKDLLVQFPDKKFVYLEGNHENCDIFRNGIKALRKEHDNLVWGRRYFKIGSGLFFHGDNEMARQPLGKREKRGIYSIAHGQRKEWRNATFELPAMWVMRKINPDEQVIDKIFKFLSEKHPERLEGVTDIFFGHTHLPIGCYEKHGIRWHNTGSAAKYGKDNFMTFDMLVPEDCPFKTKDKRVFYPGAQIENVQRVDLGGKYSEVIAQQEHARISRMIR